MAGRRIQQSLLDNESYHAWKQDIILNHHGFFCVNLSHFTATLWFVLANFLFAILRLPCDDESIVHQKWNLNQKMYISFCLKIPGRLSKPQCFFPWVFFFLLSVLTLLSTWPTACSPCQAQLLLQTTWRSYKLANFSLEIPLFAVNHTLTHSNRLICLCLNNL